MEKLTAWRISTRRLAFMNSERYEASLLVACNTRNEIEAMKFARKSVHTREWWDSHLVTAIEQVGELWAIEGPEKPEAAEGRMIEV